MTELIEKARRAGFVVTCVTVFVSLLLPMTFIARKAKVVHSANFDPLVELRLNPLLNAIFEKIMQIELSFIARGVSFPAGGSLILIARHFQSTNISTGQSNNGRLIKPDAPVD
jgi:hypothetical protein